MRTKVKDLDRVALTYNDSRNPGRIVMSVLPTDIRGQLIRLTLSPSDATELAERLLGAVRSEGYVLTARKRPRS